MGLSSFQFVLVCMCACVCACEGRMSQTRRNLRSLTASCLSVFRVLLDIVFIVYQHSSVSFCPYIRVLSDKCYINFFKSVHEQ